MRALILNQWKWQGPARLPRALKQTGWDVAMICKKGEWASLTRHVDRFFHTDTADERALLQTLQHAMAEWRPDVILPGTDNMVETLQKFRLLAEQGRVSLEPQGLKALQDSTFPHEKMRYVGAKIDLLEALKEKGVRIAPQREIITMSDAEAFVEEHGYPVVLKPDRGFAGQGIEFCHSEEDLLSSLRKILTAPSRDRYCIQKFLGIKTALIEFVAKDGALVASNSVYRLRTYPGNTGPTSVARVVTSQEMVRAAKEMAELLQYNGIGVAQFMVEDESCEAAYLIELNPRMSSFVHLWGILGTDLAQALRDAWSGKRVIEREPPVGLTMALYPQEPMRDPNSEFLSGLTDTVEDDPELAEAYKSAIATAHEKRQLSTSGQISSR